MTAEQLINRKFLQLRILALQTRISELETKLASSKQDWILVSDRLPAIDQRGPYGKLISDDVLVHLKSGGIHIDRLSNVSDRGVVCWSWNGSNVRAWMPLPEPLK